MQYVSSDVGNTNVQSGKPIGRLTAVLAAFDLPRDVPAKSLDLLQTTLQWLLILEGLSIRASCQRFDAEINTDDIVSIFYSVIDWLLDLNLDRYEPTIRLLADRSAQYLSALRQITVLLEA